MRKIIYAIGSLFLVVGIAFIVMAGITAINYQPIQISSLEFTKLFQDKSAYSSIYMHRDNIVLCMDTSLSSKQKAFDRAKKLKCRTKIRSTQFSLLDEDIKNLILKEIEH